MELSRAVLDGHAPSGARLIRLLEEGEPAGIRAFQQIYPESGRAHVVGVTGPPGSGKSTLVDGLIAELRGRSRSVGVIAVDPSSPFSGGAILGDRVRMQRHATDPGVFIRSMASRGQMGGLARTTAEVSIVLDAMGFDVILVETLGVGQDELDVASLAHTTLVVNVPGLGDEIQAIKAGILEVADVFVLNKADRAGADATEKQLTLMLHMRDATDDAWRPPLLRTVATRSEGLAPLVDACVAHRDHLSADGALEERQGRRAHRLFLELLRAGAAEELLRAAGGDPALAALEEDVRARRTDPYAAADRLLELLGPEGGRR